MRFINLDKNEMYKTLSKFNFAEPTIIGYILSNTDTPKKLDWREGLSFTHKMRGIRSREECI